MITFAPPQEPDTGFSITRTHKGTAYRIAWCPVWSHSCPWACYAAGTHVWSVASYAIAIGEFKKHGVEGFPPTYYDLPIQRSQKKRIIALLATKLRLSFKLRRFLATRPDHVFRKPLRKIGDPIPGALDRIKDSMEGESPASIVAQNAPDKAKNFFSPTISVLQDLSLQEKMGAARATPSHSRGKPRTIFDTWHRPC